MSFKEEWNLAMALDVLKSKTVEGKTWSDAAKWLMLYGPPELQEVMKQAAGIATNSCFPELEPERYSESGEPCYDIEKLAKALGVTPQEALQKMAELEDELGSSQILDEAETYKLQ